MDFIKNKKILVIAGIALIIIGVFFPFTVFTSFLYNMSYSFIGISVIRTSLLYFFAIVAGLYFFRDFINKIAPSLFNNSFGKKILSASDLFGLIPTGMCAAFVGYVSLKLLKVTDGEYVHYGFGFYLLWLGIICLAAQAILSLIKTTNSTTASTPVPAVPTTPVEQTNTPSVQEPTPVEEVKQETVTPVATAPVENTSTIEPQVTTPEVNSEVQEKFCSNCGTKVDSNNSFCTKCGNKI